MNRFKFICRFHLLTLANICQSISIPISFLCRSFPPSCSYYMCIALRFPFRSPLSCTTPPTPSTITPSLFAFTRLNKIPMLWNQTNSENQTKCQTVCVMFVFPEFIFSIYLFLFHFCKAHCAITQRVNTKKYPIQLNHSLEYCGQLFTMCYGHSFGCPENGKKSVHIVTMEHELKRWIDKLIRLVLLNSIDIGKFRMHFTVVYCYVVIEQYSFDTVWNRNICE